jgi:exoribonuclease II
MAQDLMEKGTLVEFRTSGERRLAVLDRAEGKKHWIATDERGQAHTLHPREITYTVTGAAYKPTDIAAFLQAVAPYLDPSSLEVAWELLGELGESATPATLAQLLFSEQQPAQCYAAFCLLEEDRIYFKQKADRYEPRPATQVKDLQHQLTMNEQREQEWRNFLDRLAAGLQGTLVEWHNNDRPHLDALEKFATFGEESSARAAAVEVLAGLKQPGTPVAAFNLLVGLGMWSPHENLILRRNQTPISFPSQVLELAHPYLSDPPPADMPVDLQSDRLDLTHLKVYTIDDESTQEIDDGLSVEYLPNGRERLWIHIADPTRWLVPGDPIDLEARKRSTTIYLPTGMVPMFPPALATGPMSLIQGKVCCALSFEVLLAESGAVEDFKIHASLIKVTYRLTYDDVDDMISLGLQTDQELEVLSNWAKRRQAWRQSQGAISIRMPESSIKVTGDGEDIQIHVMEDSLSRELVAEMMILAGELAARYGQQHHLPMLFRGQLQPELPSDEELMQLPIGPVRAVALRRCMPRSAVSLTPSRHASLGLDMYAQITSPIRRYGDLIAHFQIKAHLRGAELPFSIPQMQEVVATLTTTAYEAVLVERQTNRYWSLEYLRRRPEKIWPAIMLRWLSEHDNRGLVLLEDLALELPMRFDRDVQPGALLHLRVAHVDPRHDIIQFQEVAGFTADLAS